MSPPVASLSAIIECEIIGGTSGNVTKIRITNSQSDTFVNTILLSSEPPLFSIYEFIMAPCE